MSVVYFCMLSSCRASASTCRLISPWVGGFVWRSMVPRGRRTVNCRSVLSVVIRVLQDFPKFFLSRYLLLRSLRSFLCSGFAMSARGRRQNRVQFRAVGPFARQFTS